MKSLSNKGYESSGDLGPPRNAPGMEPGIKVDEDEVAKATTELENNNNNTEQYLVINNAIIDVMKVKDLKNVLGARNLNKGGLNEVLIKRLKQAVTNGMAAATDIYPAVLANMAGENFEPSAHWEILNPDGNSINRYELNDSDGYQFHAPIASVATREEDPT